MNKGDGGWANWAGMLPWYKVYDETAQTGYWGVNSGFNPVSFSDRNLIRNDVDQYRTISNAYVQWNTPLKGLFVRGEAGVDLIVNNSTHWQSTFLDPEPPYIDEAFEKSITSSVINYNIYANYDKTINNHNLNATVGVEASRDWSYTRFAEGQQLQTIYPELKNPLSMLAMGGSQGGDKYLMGIFGRLNYKFLDRYLLNASFRRDGHSALSKDNRWANFYAFGAGWIITDEGFMKDIEWLNLLKLRGSVGNPGNQNFSSYSAITTYYFNNWMLNNFGTGVLVSKFGDPNLAWQRTLDKNIGINLSMFSNRFHVTVDFYLKRTDPLIADIGIPVSMGVVKRRTNIGVQVDKGVNGTIRYAILYKPQESINYTMSVNFRYGTAFYKNIGRSLNAYNQENISKNLTRYYDGGSPTALWAVRSRGIDPATGQELFVK